jgi:hypothetical protein
VNRFPGEKGGKKKTRFPFFELKAIGKKVDK